ncbi:hypothetical protein C8R44DRAFT_412379 [Mycena epipterygia]|nr:hypothetical protein C8R44DRAFT_412379 [Mycena epipterygia]
MNPASGSEPPKSKQRRIQGACDVCKKRKTRCDGAQMPGNRCTPCITMGVDCTHADVLKTLSSARGYVAALEARVEKLERLLSKERDRSNCKIDVLTTALTARARHRFHGTARK